MPSGNGSARRIQRWVSGFPADCHDIKEKSFIKPESLQKLLTDFQKKSPDAKSVTQLACVVLAFAMVQPDDRYRLGETFLSAFPEYAERFCGSKAPGVH